MTYSARDHTHRQPSRRERYAPRTHDRHAGRPPVEPLDDEIDEPINPDADDGADTHTEENDS